MVKTLLVVSAILLAGLPAVFGLLGNASFTRDQPVRMPDRVNEGRGHGNEDHGRRHGGDDRRNRHDCRDRGHTDRDD